MKKQQSFSILPIDKIKKSVIIFIENKKGNDYFMTRTQKTIIEIRLSVEEKNTLEEALTILDDFVKIARDYVYADIAKKYLDHFLHEDLNGCVMHLETSSDE